MSPQAEKQLIKRAKRGDQDACTQIYTLWMPLVFHRAKRLMGNHTDAEDVAASAWGKAFVKLKSFRADSRLSTWLYRIVTNEAWMILRKKRPDFTSIDDEIEMHDPQLGMGTSVKPLHPQLVYEDAQLRSVPAKIDLERGLKQIPDGQRYAVTRHDLDDLEYSDVAREADYSVGAAKSQRFKGIKALRKALES